MLGGGFSSRLNQKLREGMGATYGAFAGAQGMARSSLLTASASLNADQAGPGIRALLDEVAALRSGRRPVSDAEIEEAKVTLSRTHVQRFETLSGVRGAIAGVLHRGEPLTEIRDVLDRIAALSREEVEAAAARHLGHEGSALVVVGNADGLVEAMRSAEFGPLREHDAAGGPVG